MQSDQKPSSSQGWRRFNAVQFGDPGNSRRTNFRSECDRPRLNFLAFA